MTETANFAAILATAGLTSNDLEGGDLAVSTPIDGSTIATLTSTSAEKLDEMIETSCAAFKAWRSIPPPRRGEWVRLLGEELRREKESLARLVTLDCGKIFQEGLGEVQEMIDICDFAVGISRQLYGRTIASERPGHRMLETWQPLGPVAVISAFNFPVAVWSWNAALAVVCGNPVIWKPSEKTPLTALAVQKICDRVSDRFGPDAPYGLCQVAIGGAQTGDALARDTRIPMVSATGSTPMGRKVALTVAERFGRSLLELGGNNAMIVTPSADLDLALRAVVFSAVGTAGQRCTSLRRLIVHEDVYDDLLPRLKAAYESVAIGNPLDDGTLLGPLVDHEARNWMGASLEEALQDGARISGGEPALTERYPGGAYVQPAIVEMDAQTAVVQRETFAPILYVLKYRDLEEAIALQNGVRQGLSSSIMSTDLRETEQFLSAAGSDCGIANVNIGPSGAEIGGAFGGEKETGGGRESGSDAWKAYMRRQTSTVNYSADLPLAQGISFTPEVLD
ncbi:aldehyde dehydrogenase family protein [Citromicrobium bathyomarinum]|uniref:L-piperidine-6-carboxylate dehydrogenase n=1 Tax=Citromicrobium bathyomarinum TaxID=72174 RepID=UPI000C5C5BD3|nr:aldehyde dehydrogenase family protein [Citromicrobium sp.]MBO81501.1 aldehyde dehydrogenase family protein [Citromicrobium sp.]|tara:strand:+ start:17814 stop:19340 length:1527 start_codon:yes stop_codon:yes gene_type:complete